MAFSGCRRQGSKIVISIGVPKRRRTATTTFLRSPASPIVEWNASNRSTSLPPSLSVATPLHIGRARRRNPQHSDAAVLAIAVFGKHVISEPRGAFHGRKQ